GPVDVTIHWIGRSLVSVNDRMADVDVRGGECLLVFRHVQRQPLSNASEVGGALDGVARFTCFCQCRQQYSDQNGNDPDNNQEFDKCKPASALTAHVWTPSVVALPSRRV